MSTDIKNMYALFEKQFGCAPDTGARAPGRVNVIGEHTDYNHGYVLPMAIEYDTVVVGKARPDNTLRLYAANLDRYAERTIERRTRSVDEPWTDYIMGVVDELCRADRPVTGADMVIMGDVPVGCGLSSSAALEMAALAFFEQTGGFQMDDADAARLGQRVENRFLGLSTGIMDQFISRCAQEGHALFLDCRSYAYKQTPVNFNEALFVIANTACPRGLTASKYNERVTECASAVKLLQQQLGRTDAYLRDYSLADLLACQDLLDDIPFRRARHVITENDRTVSALEAMTKSDIETLGGLMSASDASLRIDYEVTSPELDVMTRIAREHPACLGARMTGAGFGGCTINLVLREGVADFCDLLLKRYHEASGITGQVFLSTPAGGAQAIPLG